jgi:hypothetical protein
MTRTYHTSPPLLSPAGDGNPAYDTAFYRPGEPVPPREPQWVGLELFTTLLLCGETPFN